MLGTRAAFPRNYNIPGLGISGAASSHSEPLAQRSCAARGETEAGGRDGTHLAGMAGGNASAAWGHLAETSTPPDPAVQE